MVITVGKIHKVIRVTGGRLVVAVDTPAIDLQQLASFLDSVPEGVVGIKVGLPYLIHYGIRQLRNLINDYPKLYFIADLKLSDIGDIMALSAKEALNTGFNGIVAHAFTGLTGALDKLEKVVHDAGADLILQVTMSHAGATHTFDRVYGAVKEIINGVNADALIIPANKARIMRDVRKAFGRKHVILSPGIMIRGVSPGEAICAGADAEIVGRAVFDTRDPIAAAKDILKMQEEYLRKHRETCA